MPRNALAGMALVLVAAVLARPRRAVSCGAVGRPYATPPSSVPSPVLDRMRWYCGGAGA